MSQVNLIFPHQLFETNPLFETAGPFYIIEEYLFFSQYPFHKQKLAFHRASMRSYADFLDKNGYEVYYIDAQSASHDIRKWIQQLPKAVTTLHYVDPVDDWLEDRITEGTDRKGIKRIKHDSPQYLNTWKDISNYFRPNKKKFHQTTFYKQQRQQRGILMEGPEPAGGKWTYDSENRKKYPAKKVPPAIDYPEMTEYFEEAKGYVEKYYHDNPGEITDPLYPINFEQAKHWYDNFLSSRFDEFGPYEDAVVNDQSVLNHSVLSPLMNVGLITPQQIINQAIQYASEQDIRLNSVEGFVRQIIGWREFMRGLYVAKGVEQRTRNFWAFDRVMPASFYDGSTGIPPIDQTIRKVLETGYCHHIERLMVLANFMTLCEIDPDHIYQWFMELFIDAYDWVMVPNVYGMATFSDGGLMSTKPYISSSNYIRKMSNYPGGDWEGIWDGLFWRFMHIHRDFFEGNPRLSMLLSNLDRMGEDTLQQHLQRANHFLSELK